ncbi:MAG TPA: diguanylate cyclase [Kineosporiaceae bacterium]|nr:diguanylate cyclase [Kineosporiaceae bacterium]
MTTESPGIVQRAAGGLPLPRAGTVLAETWRSVGFEMVAELGRGARSTVYRVRRVVSGADAIAGTPGVPDEAPPGEFALKVLDASLSDSGPELIAFRREAALLAGVNHPGLARIHEVGAVEGRPYLVMDLVTGHSLAQMLTAGAMSAETVIAMALDIVEPLAAVHRKGLVHRDLKPPNIMVLPGGQARLIDFGLTTREGEKEALAAVGTFAYCAPEQSGMLKRPVDNRSDLYSLGVVLFECLAGVLPFQTADVGELLRMHAVTPAPDLRDLAPGTPRGLAKVVATLLAKDPDDRYQNGEVLAADLRALAGTEPMRSPIGRTTEAHVRPLSGRASELAVLNARWDRARGGHGGVCVIHGASGAGKSRLAAELASTARSAGYLVLRGKSSPDDPVPFGPLRAALEDHLQAFDQLGVDDRRRRHDGIRAACVGGSASVLNGLTPALSAILNEPDGPGGPIGPGGRDAVAGLEDQDQFALALAGLLIGLARECGALMLVLDDLQWLDPGSRRVLTLLSFDLEAAHLLVVSTARDDESSAAVVDEVVADLGAAVDVDLVLAPLDDAGVADQIEAMMPGLSTHARVVSLLSSRGRGNPFVIQEYLSAVVDAGLLQPFWGTWILDESGLDALELPNDALGLVITRVQRLGPQVRDLLIAAAAIGPRFGPEVVALVRKRDLELVLAGLVEAAGHGLIESRDGGQFAFLHDRIREALLEDLGPGERAEVHKRIAEALEAVPIPVGGHGVDHVYALAHHYLQCDHPQGQHLAGVSRALVACRAAGRLALENYAPAEAVAFLEYAVQLGNPRDSEFLLLLGTALKRAGRTVEACEWLEQALEAEPEPLAQAEILVLIADVYVQRYDSNAAAGAVERGLIKLGAQLPRNRLLLVVSTMLMFLTALFVQGTGIGLGSATGTRRRRAQSLAELHAVGTYVCVIGRRPGQLLVHGLHSLYWANQLGTGRQYAYAHNQFGLTCSLFGLRGAARRAFARADADPSSAVPSVRAMTAWSRGTGLYLAGEDNGQEMSRSIETQGRWLELGVYLDAVGLLSIEACAQGRTAEAEYLLARGQLRLGGRKGDIMMFTSSLAMTHAICGRTAQAGAELRRMTEQPIDHLAPILAVTRLQAAFVVMVEQGEFGAPFDAAVAEFEALGVTSAEPLRNYRHIHYQIALGRLEQLRSAEAAERPARLVAARAAVRLVGKAPKIDVLRAQATLARADLLVLENEPQQALTMLEKMPAFVVPDAPRLPFQTARIRARALLALGAAPDAARHVESAMAIAQTQGWPHWIRAISSEFGFTPTNHATAANITSTGRVGGMQNERLEALQQVSAAASRVLDPGVLARIALDETIRILSADRAFLFLTEGPDDDLVPHLGRDADGNDVPELTKYSTSLVERVRQSRAPLVVTGTEEGAALGAESVVLHGLRSIMVAPLELDGRLLGVVYLDSQVAKGIFTPDDVGILTALTNHIATSLETTRAAQLEISVQTARQQRDLADTLRQTLQEMSETLDPVEVTKRLLDAVTRVMHCDSAWVLSADGAEDECVLIANDGQNGETVRHPIADEPRLRALIAQERPSIGSPGISPLALEELLANATSWIALPLRTHNRGGGVLVLASTAQDAHLDDQMEVAAALAAQGTTAYDKAILFTQVQELAVIDELTGINNRRRFFEVARRDLAAAVRHTRPLVTLMIDIDHFKHVNDTHGHPTGDDVIRTVAQRLAAQIRETDLIARYGGEEFALLLSGIGPNDHLPERLRACIADTPIDTRSGPLTIHVSIGLSYLTPDDDVTTLLARADLALYRAKQDGRNCVRTG